MTIDKHQIAVQKAKKILAVAPCLNEEQYVETFLASIMAQSVFQSDSYDVTLLFVDGASDDQTPRIIKSVQNQFPQLQTANNPDRFVSHALNIGIEKAQAEGMDFLVRLDVHADYPANYIEQLIDTFVELETSGKKVGNVGGRVETLPGDQTLEAQIIASALSSKFGVGGSTFRVAGADGSIQSVDTVPFGCFRVSLFDEIGDFDTDLIRNQDDEFNLRVKRAKYEIFLNPNISTRYFARSNLKNVGRMFYQYGLFKPCLIAKHKTAATIRQFVPTIFAMFCIISPVLVFYIPYFPYFVATVLFAYLFSVLMFARDAELKGEAPFLKKYWASLKTLTTMHFTYGFGYLRGIVDLIFARKLAHNSVTESR